MKELKSVWAINLSAVLLLLLTFSNVFLSENANVLIVYAIYTVLCFLLFCMLVLFDCHRVVA